MLEFAELPVCAGPVEITTYVRRLLAFPDLVTPRLRIRPIRLEGGKDVAALADLLGDARVSSWIYFYRQPFTEVESYKWIARSEEETERGTFIMLAVEYAATGTMIGELHVDFDLARKAGDIGGALSAPFWGKGFPEEAMRALIDWLYAELQLETIILTTAHNNRSAQRVIEVLGFPYLRNITVTKSDGTERLTRFYQQSAAGWRHFVEKQGQQRARILKAEPDLPTGF